MRTIYNTLVEERTMNQQISRFEQYLLTEEKKQRHSRKVPAGRALLCDFLE